MPPPVAAADRTPVDPLPRTGLATLPAEAGPAGATHAAATPLQLPPPQVLVYSMERRGPAPGLAGVEAEARAVGDARLHWTRDGPHYEAWLIQRSPAGVRTQRSAGAVTDQGLQPRRHSDQPAPGGSEQATHFEPSAVSDAPGQIRFSSNQPAQALQAGAQDRLSVLLQLAAWAAGRARTTPARWGPGAQFRVQVAGVRDAAVWTFRVEGVEPLLLPGGSMDTWRLTRPPTGPYEPSLEVWLAPALDYLPVRLRLGTAGGGHLELRWTGADTGSTPHRPP